MPAPKPSPELAELMSIIGEANTREIVRTFLHETPLLMGKLRVADRRSRHRAAHSLKSSARLVGAHAIAARAAQFEARLALPDGDLYPADITAILEDFSTSSPALIAFSDS